MAFFTNILSGSIVGINQKSFCKPCTYFEKPQCTNAENRMIIRDRYEDAREAMHRRTVEDPSFMRRRRELVEAPFGTIKWMMARPRFLVRGLEKAKAELAMMVLAFNLKRAIAILGVQALIQRLQPALA